MRIFRFESGEVGIYEAVENYCPRDDISRKNKPDGSWLPRVGTKFPGAISFWTEEGLKKYIESGLRDWHLSVVKKSTCIKIASPPDKVLYQDEFQVICMPEEVSILETKLVVDEITNGSLNQRIWGRELWIERF